MNAATFDRTSSVRADIYFNLHRHCLSVRAVATGRVIGHCNDVCLRDVKFTVQPAGRDRVRREGKKNVHAFVRGRITDRFDLPDGEWKRATYNPYRFDTFVDADSGEAITSASFVMIDGRTVHYLEVPK